MKILILGAAGMLGSALVNILSDQDLIVADKPEWDITEARNLKDGILNCSPEWIINCAAFTNVENSEDQRELVFKVNADGPLNLGKIAEELDIPLIHISTDYVFNGLKESGYNESDLTDAINAYGKSKELGEKNIIKNSRKHYIIRTSRLFGRSIAGKENFVDKMIRLSLTENNIKVVNDQFSKPTYASDLALAIKDLIKKRPDYGIYHLTNEGAASWHDIALEIFKQIKKTIVLTPILTSEFFSKAKRPKYSLLNNTKLPKLRPWQEALSDYLKTVS